MQLSGVEPGMSFDVFFQTLKSLVNLLKYCLFNCIYIVSLAIMREGPI